MNIKYLKVSVLLILALIIYWPVFHAPFCWDDHVILDNLHHVWTFQYSRLLTNLTFLFNYHSGGLNTFGYHLVNFIIHLLTVAGIWVFTRLMIRSLKISTLVDIPFWSALLFLVHPINTEAISYLNGRSTALASLFYLGAVICYIQARLSTKNESMKYYLGMVVLTVFALMSKEIAMTLPLAWMLVDYFFFNRKISKVLWVYLVGVIGITIALFDFKIKGMVFSTFQSQSHMGDQLTVTTYLLTQLKVLMVFLKLIFAPFPLNLDYDFPMSMNLLDPLTFLSGIVLLAIGASSVVLRKKMWWVTWLVWWFFISLLTHIIPPRGNVIAEHKLYLTLILFIPVLLFGMKQLCSSRVFIIGIIVVSSVFAWLTFQRNLLWANPVLLWQDTVNKSPDKSRPYLNLGVAYVEQGNLSAAKVAYEHALQLTPNMEEAYTNLSVIYQLENNIPKAKAYVEVLLRLNPNSAVAYLQQGSLQAMSHDYQFSIDSLSKALSINSHLLKAYRMRGYLYEKLDQYQLAIEDYNAWLIYNSHDEKVLSRRADLYFKTKEYKAALSDYNQLIVIRQTKERLYNRSILYEILGDTAKMEQDREKMKGLEIYQNP